MQALAAEYANSSRRMIFAAWEGRPLCRSFSKPDIRPARDW
jgi:hypothetical protein